MKALVIGSGGRESAIVWKLRQSERVDRVYCIPTTANNAIGAQPVPFSPSTFRGIADFVNGENIGMVIVGPEAPLVGGIVDCLNQAGVRNVFGPSKMASVLEGSKIFAKQFMARNSIPTARFDVAARGPDAYNIADHFIDDCGAVVVKADGLYEGKGVFVCLSKREAHDAISSLFYSENPSGHEIVLEQILLGSEASVFVFSDGNTFRQVPVVARDYKRAYDCGPNTGGMGAVAPVQVNLEEITEKIIAPTFASLDKEGIEYKGILYLGLMLTEAGPAVIEYNCRLGDPEAQALLPLMKTDLVEVMQACIDGNLGNVNLEFSEDSSCVVVVASKGYPGKYKTGFPVYGLDKIDASKAIAFPYAVQNGKTAGGRVVSIAGIGKNSLEARENAYSEAAKIVFEGAWYRQDIGG